MQNTLELSLGWLSANYGKKFWNVSETSIDRSKQFGYTENNFNLHKSKANASKVYVYYKAVTDI